MAILFRRSNGIYYHVSCKNGRRVWRSTGARRRVDAEKQLHHHGVVGDCWIALR